MTLSKLDAISWTRGTRATGLVYATPRMFAASGSGAADGTTIVSTGLAGYSTNNTTFAGYWVKVIRAGNSTGREGGSPLMRRIDGWVHASGTATLNDDLGFQSVIGDQFELFEAPTGYVVADTAGKSMSLLDATRTEASAWWTGAAARGGPYVTVVKSAKINSAAHPRVGRSVSGVISCAVSLGASTTVGDLFEIWEHPEVISGGEFTAPRERIERPAVTGTIGTPSSMAGLVSGGGTATLAFRGPGAGRLGLAPELEAPLGAVCDASTAADLTVSSVGSTTSLTISGTPVLGAMYQSNSGDTVVCTAIAGSVITVWPPLRSSTGVTALTGMRRYVTPTGHGINYVLPIERWYGTRVYEVLFDAIPKVTINAERGKPTEVALDFVAYQSSGRQRRTASRPWRPVRPSVHPRMLGTARVYLGALDCEARSATIDLGIEVEPQVDLSAPEMVSGPGWRRDRPSGTLELWLDADARAYLRRYEGGEPMRLMVQCGHAGGDAGVLAFFAYEVEVTGIDIGDEAGKRTATIQWRECEDTTVSTIPRWALAIT